jgi:hypothetical protein
MNYQFNAQISILVMVYERTTYHLPHMLMVYGRKTAHLPCMMIIYERKIVIYERKTSHLPRMLMVYEKKTSHLPRMVETSFVMDFVFYLSKCHNNGSLSGQKKNAIPNTPHKLMSET